jgi:TrmH family RNA methyltransferase
MKKIQSVQNSIIKELILIKNNKKTRKKLNKCLLFSKKLINDLKNQIFIEMALSPIEKNLKTFKCPIQVSTHVWERLSDGVVNEDALCVVVKLKEVQLPQKVSTVCILEQVQDPGNLGSLIRSAAAFSFDLIVLISGCDPLNAKALVASRGAHFLVPTVEMNHAQLMRFLKQENLPLFVADMEGKKAQKQKKFALVLANEGSGPSAHFSSAEKVHIPIKNVDSLNVAAAGAILMSKMGGHI